MTPEERAQIVERVQTEMEVRRQVEKDNAPAKGRWSWVESKLGLLVLGAVLTGVLVPMFQATQESLRWSRQNRYDTLKYRLESSRTALRELVAARAILEESSELASSLIGGLTSKDAYAAAFIDTNIRRIRQNVKFVNALSFLDAKDRQSALTAFREFEAEGQFLLEATKVRVLAEQALLPRRVLFVDPRDVPPPPPAVPGLPQIVLPQASSLPEADRLVVEARRTESDHKYRAALAYETVLLTVQEVEARLVSSSETFDCLLCISR